MKIAKWIKGIVALGVGVMGYSLITTAPASAEATVNPHLLCEGPIKINKIDPSRGRVFSYGLVKSTWFSGFDLTILLKPGLSEETWNEVMAQALVECAQTLGKSAYSLDAYLSPDNPCFYHIFLTEKREEPFSTRRSNFMLLENGGIKRVKRKDICTEEEKKLFENDDAKTVWVKPYQEVIANAGVDLSSIHRDPDLVYEFTDDPVVRSVAVEEIQKIHKLFEKRGYARLGDRLFTTGLRNRGQIREWFFEYSIQKKISLGWFEEFPFDVEALKKDWLKEAKIILDQLNHSNELEPYRKSLWNIRGLKFNLVHKYSNQLVAQRIFVGWSHMVFEHVRSKHSGSVADRRVVRIPLEEFYQWAEAELANWDNDS